MLLPIRLKLLEGIDIAKVVLWVTRMYHGGAQMYGEGVVKKKGNWYVLHMGMLFPRVDLIFH